MSAVKLDGKYSERVQPPAKRNLGVLSPTLATPAIRSVKCKQSPVYVALGLVIHYGM